MSNATHRRKLRIARQNARFQTTTKDDRDNARTQVIKFTLFGGIKIFDQLAKVWRLETFTEYRVRTR